MQLEPVIGLEIHVQLKTKSKMFCACDNAGEDKPANTTICPICLGHPGTLPTPNAEAVAMAVKAALALNLRVNQHSKFDRKNYFYPDLPKGYQISQYAEPLASEGFLEIETAGGLKRIGIERLHLEEDTAKLLHVPGKSLVDFNRAGTPLMEIVTKPEITTPAEAKIFLQELRLIMRYVGASDADMEKGHLRCDANISLRPVGENKLYPKTEIKNLNSFRSVERALTYEIERQGKLWERGSAPELTSTRGWDEKKGETVAQREKEAVHDYRYFPEPDIPPLVLTLEQIETWREALPELPAARRKRYIGAWGLSAKLAAFLLDNVDFATYVEQVVVAILPTFDGDVQAAAKLASNWIVNKLPPVLEEAKQSLESMPVGVGQFGDFLEIVMSGSVNSTNAQVLLRKMVATGKDPRTILDTEDLAQSNNDIVGVAQKVIATYPVQVAEYQAGKLPVLKFLIGAIMKETKGRADPLVIEVELKRLLDG